MTTRMIFVGEAWGEREQLFQHALVGPSGRELARMLATAQIAPEPRAKWPTEQDMIAHWRHLRDEHGIAIANVFNARPTNNEVFEFFSKEQNPQFPVYRNGARVGWLRPEFAPHLIRLWNTISELRPNVVVALGNSACWALLNQTKITALRGTVQMSERLGVKVLPTYHPAAILRQWSMRPVGIADLIKAHRESKYSEIRRPERWITIPSPDESGILEISRWLNRPATAYANDIETAFGQISMLSFARNSSDACVIPFQRDESGASFWPTCDLEVKAWKLAIRGLKRAVPKIGQNYLYDLSYFVRMGILPRIMHGDDTMLRHHSLYPELPKSLGFLGSLYTDESAWKLMGHTKTLKRDE